MPPARPWVLPLAIAATVAACMAGVGLWVYLTSRPSPTEPGEAIADVPRDPVVEPEQPAVAARPNLAGWGILRPLPQALGPGTPVQAFLGRLSASGRKPLILKVLHPASLPEVCIEYTVTDKGKVFQELHVTECLGDLYVYVAFAASPLADLSLAVENRNFQIVRAGQAAGLTPAEVTRLRGILARLPLARGAGLEKAMWQFVSMLPQDVQRTYKAAWPYQGGGLPAIQANVMVLGEGPAVGFPLSDATALEVAFCPVIAVEGGTRNLPCTFGQFSAWWTVAIHPAKDTSFTRAEAPPGRPGVTALHWPRLSLAEVDTFIK